MKVAIITDTHFGARSDSQAFSDYFYRFWSGTFFPYLEKHNIDTVIHSGDLMDRRKYVNYDTLARMRKEFLQPMINSKITMHCIVGNHDTYYKNTSATNSIEQLFAIDGIPNNDTFHTPVIGYEEASELTLPDGYKLDLIPWINDGNEERILDFIKKSKNPVAFGHFDLSGFEMMKGVKSVYHSRSPDFLDKYDTVYSGHFHTKSDNGHVYYLGNTYEITWADYNDPRGFHIFDTETLECEFILNPNKMHSKIIYDDKPIDTDSYTNQIVKVIVDKKDDIELFNRVCEELEKKCEVLSIIEDHGLLSSDQIEFESEDTITTLEKYVDNLSIDNSKEVKKILHEIYVEALSI
jgi:DNA repair exonuclease SbcCD nuclease subunit